MNFKQFFLTLVAVLTVSVSFAQVGIGTPTPHASAQLEVSSNNKGFLPPRLTTAQRDALPSPAQGLTIYNSTNGCLEFWNATFWVSACDGSLQPGPLSNCSTSGFVAPFLIANQTQIVPVTTATGKTWMDRNLGAVTVARTATDCYAYGNLYQWGRNSDGHEYRLSNTSTTQIGPSTPSSNFIVFLNDWLTPSSSTRWGATKTVNDPCPAGYRVPTIAELEAERVLFPTNNAAGAFNYALKFTDAKRRNEDTGVITTVSGTGRYWSSTSSGSSAAHQLNFLTGGTNTTTQNRGYGQSVRCIKI